MNRREIRREFVASTPERLDHWKQQLGEVEAEKDFIREQARVFKREDDQIARAELARVAGEMAKAAEVKNEGNSPTETSFCNLSPLIQANPTLAMLNHMAESLGMRLVVGLTNK